MLLLDEPLSALDAKVRLQLREQIRTLQQRLGTTTLFVTHDQEEALSMADRVGVMRAGKLEQVAAPDELYDRPATAFVAEFVGTMNRLPGVLESGGSAVTVLGSTVPVQGGGPSSGAVNVLVRPENLTVGPGRGRQRHRLPAHLPGRDQPDHGAAVGRPAGAGRRSVHPRGGDDPGRVGRGGDPVRPGAGRGGGGLTRIVAAGSVSGSVRLVAARFPAVWLRHNCPCPDCRDPVTGQRLVDITQISNGPWATVTAEFPDSVEVTFTPDGHRSMFSRALAGGVGA